MDWSWDLSKTVAAIDAARLIKVALFDVDGVFFEARVNQGGGPISKVRSYNDGQGISWLRGMGIKVAFITNEKGDHAFPIRQTVEKWNVLPSSLSESNPGGWPHVRLYEGMGGVKKVAAAEQFLDEYGCSLSDCSYMGDDVVDLSLLGKVALPVAPAQAERIVLPVVLLRTARAGGHGAIRDFADFVLAARGIDPASLPAG